MKTYQAFNRVLLAYNNHIVIDINDLSPQEMQKLINLSSGYQCHIKSLTSTLEFSDKEFFEAQVFLKDLGFKEDINKFSLE